MGNAKLITKEQLIDEILNFEPNRDQVVCFFKNTYLRDRSAEHKVEIMIRNRISKLDGILEHFKDHIHEHNPVTITCLKKELEFLNLLLAEYEEIK